MARLPFLARRVSFPADASPTAIRLFRGLVIITGASPHSLGAECARVLALEGAGLIVLAGRNRAKWVASGSSGDALAYVSPAW